MPQLSTGRQIQVNHEPPQWMLPTASGLKHASPFMRASPTLFDSQRKLPPGTLSCYSNTDYYAYADMMWKPYERVTAVVGYAGSIVRGDTTFLNPSTPTGSLDFNYAKPLASLVFDLYKGLTYKTAWNYYGYNDHGIANPAGLAALPSQDFDGSNVTFSLRYAF
jgi:hypothetical protein